MNADFIRPAGEMRTSKRLLIVFCLIVGHAVCADSFAQEAGGSSCGSIANAYGPWDYRKDKDKLPIVIGAHFTPEVENLIRGKSSYIGADLDYTLRAIPNHPRALVSMMLYGERLKTPKVPAANYTVECYFERALRFRPDDNVVRMIYVTFLTKANRKDDGLRQLSVVSNNAAPDNPFTQYNLGLLYFDLQAYDEALTHTHKALAMGFPVAELRDKLKAAGKWTEPSETAQSAGAANADQAPAPQPAGQASSPK